VAARGGLSAVVAGTPRDRVAAAVDRYGQAELAAWCAHTLGGADTDLDRPDPGAATWVEWLGGDPGTYYVQRLVSGRPEPGYWPRVWAARALLHAWSDSAEPAVVEGLTDEHWRVREMCAKVCAQHRVDAAHPRLVPLLDDPVPRVRAVAHRALARLAD